MPDGTQGPAATPSTGFIVDAAEDEIRAVLENHPDGLDADRIVDLYRAPFECWKGLDLCWDVSEAGAIEVLRGEWDLIAGGLSGKALQSAVVGLINEADEHYPPGLHPTREEERRFVENLARFDPTVGASEDGPSDDGVVVLPRVAITGENIGKGSGAFPDTTTSRDWCVDGGANDDVTSTYGTLNVKASSPWTGVGTQARVKATSTTARDLVIDGEYCIMTTDPNAPVNWAVRTEHAYAESSAANALSITLNSDEEGANYKGSGGCATADGSAEWCACRNPFGAVYDL